MRDRVEILGVKVDRVTFNEALDIAEGFVKTDGVSTIFTPNAEIVMCAQNDAEMMAKTTMNPASRRLVAVTPADAEETARIFDTLLGDDLPARKEFIAKYGKLYVKDADV